MAMLQLRSLALKSGLRASTGSRQPLPSSTMYCSYSLLIPSAHLRFVPLSSAQSIIHVVAAWAKLLNWLLYGAMQSQEAAA